MRFVGRVACVVLPMTFVPVLALAQTEPPKGQPPASSGSASAPAPSATPPATNGAATAPSATSTVAAPPTAAPTSRPLLPPTMAPSSASLLPVTASDLTASTPTTAQAQTSSAPAKPTNEVFAEEWWTTSRPVLELHGYFRMRAELFHNFSLGRVDPPGQALWPQPADNHYADYYNGQSNPHTVALCGTDPLNPGTKGCDNKTQAGANLRFRLNPELHISDNLRVVSQIDLLDNLVMGSTPEGYANSPAVGANQAPTSGFWRTNTSGYTALSANSSSQVTPTAGENSYRNSISVKRVWGEYITPIGAFKFGRMPDHWGLGMVYNAGNTFDSDYQTTVDRIMFTGGIRPLDLYISGAWDFPNEGATSQSVSSQQGQPYDLSQMDDVSQYSISLARKRAAAVQRLDLARGDVVINGGVYFAFRNQFLANDAAMADSTGQNLGAPSDSVRQGYVRRDYKTYTPDAWIQILYKKFRFEAEFATVQGSMNSTTVAGGTSDYRNLSDTSNSNNGWKIRQYGVTTQTEFKAVEDKLRLNFGFGWSSGDSDVIGLTPGNSGVQTQRTSNRTFSTFRFHPNHRVDLILFRHILNRVQGAYYFRPSVDYDFSRNPNGQRLGGGAAIIWSRASEFAQTPGHRRDLGVEIDLSLYYQSKDGSLNDSPDKMGGFFTMLQYGVLFPLWGLDYMEGEKSDAEKQNMKLETSAAQTLRWYCGILF